MGHALLAARRPGKRGAPSWRPCVACYNTNDLGSVLFMESQGRWIDLNLHCLQ